MAEVPCDTCGGIVEIKGEATSVTMCSVCYTDVMKYETACQKEEEELLNLIKKGNE